MQVQDFHSLHDQIWSEIAEELREQRDDDMDFEPYLENNRALDIDQTQFSLIKFSLQSNKTVKISGPWTALTVFSWVVL